MPRKGHIQKRDVLADPLYNNKVVTKLINNIMLDGKKGSDKSQPSFLSTLFAIDKKNAQNSLRVPTLFKSSNKTMSQRVIIITL